MLVDVNTEEKLGLWEGEIKEETAVLALSEVKKDVRETEEAVTPIYNKLVQILGSFRRK